MFNGRDNDNEGTAPPRLSLRHRVLLSLPTVQHGKDKEPLGQRLRNAMLKPVEPDAAARAKAANKPASVAELEDAVRYADDKERLMGLLLAPVAAAIGLVVIAYLTNHDPAALVHGKVNPKHVSLSLYHDLTFVLLGLSVVMLATAYFRKRLFLGITMALYGLSVFNLHQWGFGIPFLMLGAWLLVRSYRLQRDLNEATGAKPARAGAQRRGVATSSMTRAQANKRYTPRTAPKRLPLKPVNQKAG